MRRREFLSSVVGGMTGALPLAAEADAPEPESPARRLHEELAAMAAEYDQLSGHADGLLWDVQMLNLELVNEDRNRTQILSLVHAMRAPLVDIELATRFLRDNTRLIDSDELRRHLDTSATSCQRLAELINDVCELEKSWLGAEADDRIGAAEKRYEFPS
jgi:signal transduction histidine kinase